MLVTVYFRVLRRPVDAHGQPCDQKQFLLEGEFLEKQLPDLRRLRPLEIRLAEHKLHAPLDEPSLHEVMFWSGYDGFPEELAQNYLYVLQARVSTSRPWREMWRILSNDFRRVHKDWPMSQDEVREPVDWPVASVA